MKKRIEVKDISRRERTPLAHLENEDLMPLPAPLESPAKDHAWTPLSAQAREKYECGLDDTCALNLPQPKSEAEERQLVERFLAGLDKLFTRENNWTFLAAPAAHHGALRPLPDLLGCLPHLRGQRRQRSVPAHLPRARSCAGSTSST